MKNTSVLGTSWFDNIWVMLYVSCAKKYITTGNAGNDDNDNDHYE